MPGWKLKDFISGVKSNISSPGNSVLGDIAIYLIIGGVGLSAFIIAFLIMMIPKYRLFMFNKLMAIRKSFIWNGVIRSINVSWTTLLITSGTQIEMWLRGSSSLKQNDFHAACGIFAFNLLYTTGVTR